MSNDNNKVTLETLRQRQKWPLEQKIDHALATLDVFISRMDGKCFVSCSFGKDSLVLLDLARRIKPDMLAVWCNTGMENPSLVKTAREHIAAGENVKVIRPAMTFRQVVAKHGFPLVSKETSYKIWQIRNNPDCASSQKFLHDRKSKFCLPERWMWLIDEVFDTSNKCCKILKKDPMHRFIKESGLSPILGTMASESEMRKGHYIRGGGCNVWNSASVPLPPPHNAECKPLSIWMEDDVYEYARQMGITLPEAYTVQGCTRTGCQACGFGISKSDDNRFDILYKFYPKYYDIVMKIENNGVTFRQAVRKVLAVVGKHLPDETPKTLFDYDKI